MSESHKRDVKQQQQILKECVINDFIYMKFKRSRTNLW